MFLTLIGFLPLVSSSLYCGGIKYSTVGDVDIKRYSGLWYEYSHSKNFIFEEGCSHVTAEYTETGEFVLVNNTCFRNGEYTSTVGTAEIDYDTPGRLDVKFYDFQKYSPYDIIYLTEDYDVAVVFTCNGTPLTNIMWFLTRYQNPEPELVNKAMFSVNELMTVEQVVMVQ